MHPFTAHIYLTTLVIVSAAAAATRLRSTIETAAIHLASVRGVRYCCRRRRCTHIRVRRIEKHLIVMQRRQPIKHIGSGRRVIILNDMGRRKTARPLSLDTESIPLQTLDNVRDAMPAHRQHGRLPFDQQPQSTLLATAAAAAAANTAASVLCPIVRGVLMTIMMMTVMMVMLLHSIVGGLCRQDVGSIAVLYATLTRRLMAHLTDNVGVRLQLAEPAMGQTFLAIGPFDAFRFFAATIDAKESGQFATQILFDALFA